MVLYVVLVLYSALSDARSLRIPNWTSLSLMGVFGAGVISNGLGLEAIAWHLAAVVLMLVLGFTLFAFGHFGGGDAKLMAACALMAGWDNLFAFIFAVALVGGVLSILVILLRKGLGLWPDWLVKSAAGLFTPDKAVPYGLAIAAGAMIILPRMDMLPKEWVFVVHWFVG
ncbi:MAG: prepilin peptidase [Magnetovibrio sp.]|nr:prepilin peptidase [Magnetovibrio sp.]